MVRVVRQVLAEVVVRHHVCATMWAHVALVVSFLVRRAAAESRSLFGHEDSSLDGKCHVNVGRLLALASGGNPSMRFAWHKCMWWWWFGCGCVCVVTLFGGIRQETSLQQVFTLMGSLKLLPTEIFA